MNLLMVSVLLIVALVCQPTLIYGLKGSHIAKAAMSTSNGDHDLIQHQRSVKAFGGKVKRSHSNSPHASPAELASAKLVMALESGDVLVRRAARGANVEGVGGMDESTTPIDASGAVGGGLGGSKRNKNGNNNKKLNRNSEVSNGGRKQDKKYSATIGSQQQQQQQQQQQHHGHHGNGSGNGNGNGNGRGRQRQQHQGHGKRGGNGGNGNGSSAAAAKMRIEGVEKSLAAEKSQTSCRYSKSAWTDCDPKTNTRTRTLTLKKGENSCLATRTMQKKCRKSCRYEKGAWSECINGQMMRQDKLKSPATVGTTDATNIDSSCEPVRNINKKCNPGVAKMGSKANKERKHKDKVQRRSQQQA